MKNWRDRNNIIFHIDCNSAYLSWESVYRLSKGITTIDYREVPAIVGGDPKTRRGIVLTKSIPAKKYGIQTGESLYIALQKCPHLVILKPSYGLYMMCSNAMMEILEEYSPKIQRFSIDEVFLDYTGMHEHFGDPVTAANNIRERIENELGFTVNIGISSNKLLAKMASDNLGKPNKTHELWPEQIKEKFWPLPIEDLFMVGRATAPKLHKIGIRTIGDLATTDLDHVKYVLKSHGVMIWEYANGIEDSTVRKSNYVTMKGVGNGTTIPYDIDRHKEAYYYLLSLSESIGMRLRASNSMCEVVQISIRYSDLSKKQHQKKLFAPTDVTDDIYRVALELFNKSWTGEPLRQLRIRTSSLVPNTHVQSSFFDRINIEKARTLDKTVDDLRKRFGKNSIIRAALVDTELSAVTGGIQDEYPMMTSLI